MTLVDAVFTRSDYMQLPEGFPAQLVEGCLVRQPAPSFGHQHLVGMLYRALAERLGARRVGLAPLDIALDELNVYQPDIVVFADDILPSTRSLPVPVLAIEVLSPSTARRDRGVKTRRLLAAGVREVWLVDADTETLEVRTTAGTRVERGDRPVRSRVVSGFELVPAELFAA